MIDSALTNLLRTLCALVLLSASAASPVRAQDASEPGPMPVPLFWRIEKPDPAPDLSVVETLKIITGDDYPPFHFRDAEGSLRGFNVEIITGICETLRLNCEISIGAHDTLIPALVEGRVDVVAASLARSEANMQKVDLSKPYYRSPAVFAVRLQNPIKDAIPRSLAGRRLGVLAGTGHEQFLKTYFGRSSIRPYSNMQEATEALRVGNIDALFGDSVPLMYWMAGQNSRTCCRLANGAYWESYYFGNGAALATKKGRREIMVIINYGLDRIKESGFYDRVYRKYFPLPIN